MASVLHMEVGNGNGWGKSGEAEVAAHRSREFTRLEYTESALPINTCSYSTHFHVDYLSN